METKEFPHKNPPGKRRSLVFCRTSWQVGYRARSLSLIEWSQTDGPLWHMTPQGWYKEDIASRYKLCRVMASAFSATNN